MNKILKNAIAFTALLSLSTLALPAFALEANSAEGAPQEVLVAQRVSQRGSRSTTTRCTTVRRTRRWLYQRCQRTTCTRRGTRGRIRCRLVSSWRRRILRTSGRFSRGEIPRTSGIIWRRD